MKLILSSIFCLLAIHCSAQTIINTPTVQGTWTASGSPYYIDNDIMVNVDDTLVIQPGVSVTFRGNFRFSISGSLTAIGTADSMITFSEQDTTGWYIDTMSNGAWAGILFYGAISNSPQVLKYCNIQDMKVSGFYTERSLTLSHCNIFHNKSSGIFRTWIAQPDNTSGAFIMDSCNYYNNTCSFDHFEFWDRVGTPGILNVHIYDNSFHNNSLGTVLSFNSTVSTIERNEFYDNTVDENKAIIYFSGAMDTSTFTWEGSTTIRHNKIYRNTGVNIAPINGSNSYVDIDGNYICNNKNTKIANCGFTDGGGGIRLTGGQDNADSAYLVRNNLIANNYTGFCGGGIYIFSAKARISNNTIVHNESYSDGGGIAIINPRSRVWIKNNIFFENRGHYLQDDSIDVFVSSDSTVLFDNNWTQHSFADALAAMSPYTLLGDTTHNVKGINPGFVAPTQHIDVNEDALTADFSLLTTSGCIDMGDTTAAYAGIEDYAGNARIQMGGIDIGAIEKDTSIHVFVPNQFGNKGVSNISIFPNPANEHFTVSYAGMPGNGAKIELSNMTGVNVLSVPLTGGATEIGTAELAEGIYFCKVVANGARSVFKIVVAHR